MSVALRIRDTGMGIPPDQLAVIFESFRQLETGLSRNHAGLGLGLAVLTKAGCFAPRVHFRAQRIGKGKPIHRQPAASSCPWRPEWVLLRLRRLAAVCWWWMTIPSPKPLPAMLCGGSRSKWNAPATGGER